MRLAAPVALALLGCGTLALPGTAAAAADPAPPSLKSCNKEADAKGLTGKERAAFVKDCLSGKSSPKS